MWPMLLGKALSPFFAVLLIWLVTAPARRRLERTMPAGLWKRLLLMDRDLHPWKFSGCIVLGYVLLITIIAVLSY